MFHLNTVARIVTRTFSLVAVSVVYATIGSAQARTGTPPFGSFDGEPDGVNLANLNVHLTIPIVTKLENAATAFQHDLTFDSSIWYPVNEGTLTRWQKVANWGWASHGMFNVPTVPSISAENPVDFTYTAPNPDPSRGPISVAVTYLPYMVRTNFGCPSSDYAGTTHLLLDRVTLSDGTYYQFTYERTPEYPGSVTGRIASVAFPSGRTISYQYSGGGPGINGIHCADGSGASLTRTTPEGIWTYEHVNLTTTKSATTITDPRGNQTFLQFNGIYETARYVYKGAIAPANLMKSFYTCYSSVAVPPCNDDPIKPPIGFRSITTRLSDGETTLHTEIYDTHSGLPIRIDEYDSGRLIERMEIKYATSPELTGNGIVGRPQTITILDGSSAGEATQGYCGSGELALVDPTLDSDAVTSDREHLIPIRSYSLVTDKRPSQILNIWRPTIWDFLHAPLGESRTRSSGDAITDGCTRFSMPTNFLSRIPDHE